MMRFSPWFTRILRDCCSICLYFLLVSGTLQKLNTFLYVTYTNFLSASVTNIVLCWIFLRKSV